MVYSASIATAESSRFTGYNAAWFLGRQALYLAAAFACALTVFLVPARVWQHAAPWLFLAGVALLVVVLIPGVGREVNGAKRWIALPLFSLQPSEFAKVAWVLAMARYLMYRENHRRIVGVLWPLVLTLVPVLLILREPDLGTALVFLPVLFVLLAIAGASRADLVGMVLAGLLAMPLLWTQMSHEQQSRVTALFQQTSPHDRSRQRASVGDDDRSGHIAGLVGQQEAHDVGDIVGLGSISYVTNVPKNQYVFEETLRVIVDPPLVWRARGGYLIRFGSSRQHSAGLVGDALNVPGREDSTTVRAGPVIRIVLSRRVEVRGSFVPTVFSPDHSPLNVIAGVPQDHATANAGITNILNLKLGVRTYIGQNDDLYVGFGQCLTPERWYNQIVRVEYRRSW
jgi:hypothetical protein